jgi:putative colanic acid biosynthesis UDP-glucose lipid carrier transferase
MGMRLADLCLVALAGAVAAQFRFPFDETPGILDASLVLGTLVAAHVLPLLGVYDLQRLGRVHRQVPRLLAAWLLTIGAVLVFLYAIHAAHEVSRLWIGYWLLLGASGLIASRLLLQGPFARRIFGRLDHRVALVGQMAPVDTCVRSLGAHQASLRVDLTALSPHDLSGAWAELDLLEKRLTEHEIDQVVLAGPSLDPMLEKVLERLRQLPVEVAWAPQPVAAGAPVLGADLLGQQPLVLLQRRPIDGWRYLAKEGFDRTLALLALILLSPLLLLIAGAIKLSSPGPVFYRQPRYGFDREVIKVFKFRSMYSDRCDPADETQVRQAVRGDPRITPLGRLLRRTSLDELPQLLNVIRGDMSLVGPRPHPLACDRHYAQLIDGYLRRHRVKPGITGWAQVNGYRGETETLQKMQKRIEHDLHYIENWSLLLDVRIICTTVLTAFHSDHVY